MNKPISQIPRYTSPVFHNTPIGDRNVHVSVENGVLWDLELVLLGFVGLYYTQQPPNLYDISKQYNHHLLRNLRRLVSSHPILSHLTTSYHIISHHISHPARSYQSTVYHIPYYHITSHHIFYHIIYYPFISHHIKSYPITSHSIISHPFR